MPPYEYLTYPKWATLRAPYFLNMISCLSDSTVISSPTINSRTRTGSGNTMSPIGQS